MRELGLELLKGSARGGNVFLVSSVHLDAPFELLLDFVMNFYTVGQRSCWESCHARAPLPDLQSESTIIEERIRRA